jgi:excisionase family DNA binding protein
MNSGNDSEYLNVRETARMLQVHANTVRNWAANGVLKSSKVPGARAHRFERTEVERLQRDRGASASSVGRPLRQDGPELVGPFDLDAWAPRDDAKTAFPELMDRLLTATAGITNVNVRSHEGTSAHGWDGTANSKKSSFLPNGKLFFEFGTDKDPKKKAEADYTNRQGALSDPKSGTFVFATPKNWPGAKKWATDKEELGEYAGVEAFDAHRLSSWIRSVPSVHYWLSERLGYSPRDAQTLEAWWSNFQDGLTIKLPGAFFTAGRESAVKSLVDRLTSAGDSSDALTVKASTSTDALAFIFGALATSDLLSSVMVIRDRQAWERIVDSSSPLILIPTFERPSIASANTKGHRVLLLAGAADLIAPGHIGLSRIDRLAAGEAMNKATKNFNEARKLVSLARRDMPAFLRAISKDPRAAAPAWASDGARTALLARLILISTWSNRDVDHELVAQLTSTPWPEIERTLKGLEREGNPVYVASGDSWQLGAPKEAAQLLLPQLIADDIKSWKNAAGEVLLSPNPYLGMDYSARMQAQVEGVRPQHSSELQRGVALSLALAASSDVYIHANGPIDNVVGQILHSVWNAASADDTGSLWGSLSDEMPLLAEASPSEFLDAVEADLDQKNPLLVTLFQDEDSDTLFGASSPHTGLLWALETLCWSPEHFRRAAEALARFANLDPGGKLSNRPAQSFVNVLSGWVRQSGATTAEKLDLLAALTESMPDTVWPLLVALLPESHGSFIPPHGPTYRDWASETTSVLMSDWAHFAKGVLKLAIGLAPSDPSRWAQLVDRYEQLPPHDRSELLQAIKDDAALSAWSPDGSHALWQTLDGKIRRHEEYSETDWAMSPDDLAKLKSLAEVIASDSDPRRHIGLFEWRMRYRRMKYGDEGFEEALGQAQVAALTEVVSQGIDALRLLTLAIKNTQTLGWQLGLVPSATDLDKPMIEWLESPDDALRGAARAYVQNRILTRGWSWLESVYHQAKGLGPFAKQLFTSAIPFSREYWLKLDERAPALVDAYWSQGHFYLANDEEYVEAIARLLDAGHPWAAVAVISNYMHPEDQSPELSVVKKALASLIKTTEPMTDHSMSPYYVEQLLEFMEREVPDDPDLASYEFALFGLLHLKNPSLALYRALNNEPGDFILMVRSLYRGENEEKREPTAKAKSFANRAWEILHDWKGVPGQLPDGTIDSERLQEWVRAARFAFEESGHTSVGDEQIGEVLSASPVGADGNWPAEAVREVVESIASVRLETGLQIGLRNRRGVTSRSPYEGGTQERALQQRYQDMSIALAPKWRRTSRVLRAIADAYGREARSNDDDAERDADRE